MFRNCLLLIVFCCAGPGWPSLPAQQRQTPPAPESPPALAELEAKARAETPYQADPIMTLPPARLIEILRDREASAFAKAKACQRLAVVGDETAAPALAALLTDPKLSHYARFGLEPIPGAAADEALREAMEEVEGELLVGVISSIGLRKDKKAIPSLAKLLHHSDREVAAAAAAALARIRGF